jgi:hypothetical protein
LRRKVASEVFDLKPTRCRALRLRISLSPRRQAAKRDGAMMGVVNTVDRCPRFHLICADWRDPHGGRNPDLSDSIEMVESNP